MGSSWEKRKTMGKMRENPSQKDEDQAPISHIFGMRETWDLRGRNDE